MLNAHPGCMHNTEVDELEDNNLLCHEANEDLSLEEQHVDPRILSDSLTTALDIYNHCVQAQGKEKIFSPRLMVKISV